MAAAGKASMHSRPLRSTACNFLFPYYVTLTLCDIDVALPIAFAAGLRAPSKVILAVSSALKPNGARVIWANAAPSVAGWRRRRPATTAILQDITMQSRTRHSHVTFGRPLRLAGMDSWAPSGRYTLALEEEQRNSLTVGVWRQTSVTLQIVSAGASEHLRFDPTELHDALLRDCDDRIDPVMPLPNARPRDVFKLRRL